MKIRRRVGPSPESHAPTEARSTMELPALIYLVALIDTGSAAGAAEALGVGSSTVNHAVAALEQAM
ncbi:LysR family transcriptional regulator, partial [Nguyenibacter vanlangensis]|nr:LysR family transcriptional regulator [Nguyenibacter vanlangensis]